MRRLGSRALASATALGLICALGAAGPASGDGEEGASASRVARCGEGNPGYPRVPPKRYRFRIQGTTKSETHWGDGKETYLYRGVMKRVICRGTHVEYWQTRGKVSQTFTNILIGPNECGFTGIPPHAGIGNSPTRTRPLKRFEVDVGFVWIGREYQTSVINPRNGQLFAHGTVRCPPPPAASGATVPYTFEHVSTDLFYIKGGPPRRVVKGKIVNYLDFTLYRYTFRWRLTAPRPLKPNPY